jgi:hypothetical protein
MQYTLMFYLSPSEFTARTDPQQRAAFWGAFLPYMQSVRDAGIFAGGAGLEPPDTATTVRLRDGKRLVQDGPYADNKEQLGGFFLIWPTTGALVARAAAIAEARGAQAGWEQLEAISADRGKSYQPYWALAAHLLGRLGRKAEAETAYTRAIGLCEESAMREFLRKQMDNLKNR